MTAGSFIRLQKLNRISNRRFSGTFTPPSTLVEGNDYLLKLTRYIHLNPVCGKRWEGVPVDQRREQLRAYRWSTYRSYLQLETDWAFVDYGPVKALVEQLGVSYEVYVEVGLASTDAEFLALYRQARLSLGSDEFGKGVRAEHERAARKARRAEDVAFRGMSSYRSVAETLVAVAAAFQMPELALHQRRRNSAARGAAAWALVRQAGLTERAAGEILGTGTGSAVSQRPLFVSCRQNKRLVVRGLRIMKVGSEGLAAILAPVFWLQRFYGRWHYSSMARANRLSGDGGILHVTHRCHNREFLMGQRQRYRLIELDRLCWRLQAASLREVRNNLESALSDQIAQGQSKGSAE